MIRINLLKSLNAAPSAAPQVQEAALKPSGSSTFISKREVALGGLFLVLGGVILATQVFDVFEDPALVEQMSGDPLPKETAVEMPAPPPEPSAASDTEPSEAAEPAPSQTAAAQGSPAREGEPTVPESSEPKPSPNVQPPEPEQAPAAGSVARISGDAVAVSDIQVVPWGDAAEVFIAVVGSGYSTFRLDNPPRFVIDIKNAELRVPSAKRSFSVDHPLIQVVRAAQNSLDPPIVRVVIETAAPAPEVSETPKGISVKLGPQG